MKRILYIIILVSTIKIAGLATAGPDYIEFINSVAGNEGVYTKNGTLGDCDCWENTDINRLIIRFDDDMWTVVEGSCTAAGQLLEGVGFSTSCDPTVLPNVIETGPPPAIPTLSQWGLIILGLVMGIAWTVSFNIMRST